MESAKIKPTKGFNINRHLESFQVKKSNPTAWILIALPVFVLGLALSYTQHLANSELWTISNARFWGQISRDSYFLYAKPLFYGLLKWPYLFEFTNTQHILAARITFGFIGASNLLLSLKLVRSITGHWFVSFIYLLILVSFYSYFSRFFRIRSDVLSYLFFILNLNIIWTVYQNNNRIEHYQKLIMILSLCCFLCTPKAIYLILLSAIFYISLFRSRIGIVTRIIKAFFVFLLPVVVWISLVAIFGLALGINAPPLTLALSYFIKSFDSFLSSAFWFPLGFTIKVNFAHFTLIILCSLFSIWRASQQEEGVAAILSLSIGALFFLLIHPEKWHFFIALMLPMISLPIVFLEDFLPSRKTVISAIVLCTFMGPFMTHFRGWAASNQWQLKSISEIAHRLKPFSDQPYFDSTGILPRHKVFPYYVDQIDRATVNDAIENTQQQKPTFIFLTSKLRIAGPWLTRLLFSEYQDLGSGLWVKNSFLKEHPNARLAYSGPPLWQVFNYTVQPQARTLW